MPEISEGIGSETYGEILPFSFSSLLKKMNVTSSDHIIDFGSGIGKTAMQCFLESPASKVTGIEIQSPLHQIAKTKKAQLYAGHPELFIGKSLEFREGDFLQQNDLNGTIAYICSTCFEESLLDALTQYFDEGKSFFSLLSLKPLGNLKHYRLEKSCRVECSWDTAVCYLYERCQDK